MMSAVSAVPMGMLSAATCDELSSIHTCSCCQSCAWRVIFGSTARRSRRRSPAGRRRRRRPRGMRIRCVRSRCARCTSGRARRDRAGSDLASASDAPRARTAGPISTEPGGTSVSCVLRIQRARYERRRPPESLTRPIHCKHDRRSKWPRDEIACGAARAGSWYTPHRAVATLRWLCWSVWCTAGCYSAPRHL